MADAAVQMGCELGKSLVTGWLWSPIKCHLDYWRCFRDNVQGLRDEFGLLKNDKNNMNQRIEDGCLRAERPTTDVQGWLEVGDQKLEEAERILQGCDGLKAWNIVSRYSWGKRAKKITEGIAKLRNEANEIRISDPAPPPAMAPIPHKRTMEFESRQRVEDDIMGFLRDDHTCMIAICGAGGIGKTTMVHRIEDRVRKENLFDEVAVVVVSQPVVMHKIQMEIAESLGLKFSEDTLAARAHKLHIRLQDSKRKLIIFDDVWESFKLKDIGVPVENGFTKCKIILTSRIIAACNKMGAKIIRMELLNEEEAWALFKGKAGSYVEDPDLRPIAESVVAECKGLPVAIVTVGVALKDQSIHVWKNSLFQLSSSTPIDFPEVLEAVYKPLKLSYRFLENRSLKSRFLLCCLFPEDYNIPIEHLTLYGFGLGIFQGIRNIEEGRNKTHSAVENLKSRFLLLDGDVGHSVKMHDVVRDVAIFIGSKEEDGFLMNSLEAFSMDSSSKDSSRNCNWMSIDISTENAKLPVGSDFPNLRLMMIQNSTSLGGNNICFEGMEGLNVLSISGINVQSFPPTLELLKKLKKLRLHDYVVQDISILAELASLEILCIHECDFIEELPVDIGRLKHLRLLEMISCGSLKRIAIGVLSNLVRLEALKIRDCFKRWEAQGNQREQRNASLSELESLPNLTCLEIDISDCNLFVEEIFFSQRLVRYNINSNPFDLSNERKIKLILPRGIIVANWIHQLVRSSQSLELRGDGSNNFNLAEIKSLRNLVIRDCSTVKKLVNVIGCEFSALVRLELNRLTKLEELIDGSIPEESNSFQRLESLHVDNLPRLVHLWKSQNISLDNLKSISITSCRNLCYLFPVATVRSLVQLQCLEIEGCDKIKQVFWNEIENNTDSSITEFPNLQEVMLSDPPNHATFFQEVEIIEFLHQLTKLVIKNCPKLRTKVGQCPNLRLIHLSNFNGQHHLLCSRRMTQYLHISKCDTIEEISWDDIKDEGEHHIMFPELIELELSNLPCLTTFCRGVQSIKFPKLGMMVLKNLQRLNSLLPLDFEGTHDDHSLHFFCNPKVEIPSLKELYLVELQDIISKIWCRNVPINFFHNLKRLYIYDVNGISNFISSSIAKNFVNLEYLYIERCQVMVEVVEDEKEELIKSPFPKLEFLHLGGLFKLRSFCQWKHAFELPSIEEVEIVDCPVMETFTLGLLSTPNLSKLEINDRRIITKDLNGGIRDRRRTKAEMKTRIWIQDYYEDGDEES